MRKISTLRQLLYCTELKITCIKTLERTRRCNRTVSLQLRLRLQRSDSRLVNSYYENKSNTFVYRSQTLYYKYINYDMNNCYALYIRSFVAASSLSDSRTKEDTTAGLSTRVPTTNVYVSTTSEAVKTSATSVSEDNVGR